MNFLIVHSYATKPCSSQSYYSNSARSLQEWIEASGWVAKVKIAKIDHKWVPWENCYIEDKTKCNRRDDGTLKVEILDIIKGNHDVKGFKLKPNYCSKELPDKVGIYIFYGSENGIYDGYEFIRDY